MFSTSGGKGPNQEVFTLTLGSETIELLPLKNWSQLDHFKWTTRGKLPGEPTGLEVAPSHVKIAGDTVALNDPAGCVKLERLFNEWLLLERRTLELARNKSRPQALSAAPQAPPPNSQCVRFRVEVDKRGQVHIYCVQGKDILASIGLTLAGFNSLVHQGLMRKPHTLSTGALHDWVELDGELCSFEKGRNDTARLEKILNDRYAPEAAAGLGKEIVIFLNAVSSTGFDIQFPVTLAGVPDNRRRHLNEESLTLLQDPVRCDLLHKDIIIKLSSPNLVFKQKTPDGGEQYLSRRPENTLTLTDDEGRQKTIDLTQPLNLLRLGPAELTAVFNHQAIHRHTKVAPPRGPATELQASPVVSGSTPSGLAQSRIQPAPSGAVSPPREEPAAEQKPPFPSAQNEPKPPTPVPSLDPEAKPPETGAAEPALKPAGPSGALPNLWLSEILSQPALEHDWFACLAYSKMAEHFGNSTEGKFGPTPCWFVSLGETEDIEDPAFKGIFLTEKRSLGFLNAGQMARFYNGVAFIGPRQEAFEGIQIRLVAIGMDGQQRIVFIVSEHYRAQFGVPEITLAEVLNRLSEHGALVMSATETLASRDPLELVWTVPAEQTDPAEPQALESTRPST